MQPQKRKSMEADEFMLKKVKKRKKKSKSQDDD